jgi:23S rRNA (cytosine1962-C5)-methyltransferase
MLLADQYFPKIQSAMQLRGSSIEDTNAFRLFNGFYEGFPGLVIDRYGETLVIFNHGEPGNTSDIVPMIVNWTERETPEIQSVLLKQRQSPNKDLVEGILISGKTLTQSIEEFGITYALDLQINQDASFYLDTRNLRRWLLEHSEGIRVLNTFAYTGSLGVAAGVGKASEVVQTDLNPAFLDIAEQSWMLNELDPGKCKIIPGDFFRITGRMRNSNDLYGCVILDPPYFSTTEAGRVDLQGDILPLINKVRPLVAHEGWLVIINNALFVSGQAFMDELNILCESPYLSFEEIIPVPEDVTGYADTIVDSPPVDPSPFNHPTKIAILKVFRKDNRK